MTLRPCRYCDSQIATHGLRFPGLWRDQTAKGYAWTCAARTCRDKAEAARAAKLQVVSGDGV